MVSFQERRHEGDRREQDKYEYVCEIHGVLSHTETHCTANEHWCSECLKEHFLEHNIKPTMKKKKVTK